MTNTWKREKEILENFKASRGNHCEWPGCKSTENLEIHHQLHGKESKRGRARGSARAYEVLKHPLRFLLLCRTHHIEAHPGGFRFATVDDEIDTMEEQFLKDHPEVTA